MCVCVCVYTCVCVCACVEQLLHSFCCQTCRDGVCVFFFSSGRSLSPRFSGKYPSHLEQIVSLSRWICWGIGNKQSRFLGATGQLSLVVPQRLLTIQFLPRTKLAVSSYTARMASQLYEDVSKNSGTVHDYCCKWNVCARSTTGHVESQISLIQPRNIQVCRTQIHIDSALRLPDVYEKQGFNGLDWLRRQVETQCAYLRKKPFEPQKKCQMKHTHAGEYLGFHSGKRLQTKSTTVVSLLICPFIPDKLQPCELHLSGCNEVWSSGPGSRALSVSSCGKRILWVQFIQGTVSGEINKTWLVVQFVMKKSVDSRDQWL